MTENTETVEKTESVEQAAPQEETKAAVEATPEKNPLEREIEFSVKRADIEKSMMTIVRNRAKTARFNGFRKGKAPMGMVMAAYGMEAEQEAFSRVTDVAVSKLIQDYPEDIVSRPTIDFVNRDGGDANDPELKLKAIFEVAPQVVVPDLKTVKVTKFECTMSDEDLNRTISVMQKQRAVYNEVPRACKDEDKVTIDFEGKLGDKVFDGGKANDFSFVLGQGQMLPEFEVNLKGMSAGEEKTFPMTFPENYGAKEMAGKEVSFTVKLKAVAEPKYPELDDDFARSLGVNEGGIEKLKADVRDNLNREVNRRLEQRTKQNVMTALLKAVNFPVPRTIVEQERNRMVQNNINTLKSQGITVPENLITDQLMRPQATDAIRLSYLIREIIEQQNITATQEEIRKVAEDIAKSYEDPSEVVEWYMNNKERKDELTAVVRESNVVKYVLDNADTKIETVKFDALMAGK